MIVVRDRDSYAIAKEIVTRGQGQGTRGKERGENQIDNNVILYQDFAQETILGNKETGTRDEYQGTSSKHHVPRPYILININKQSVDVGNIKKITEFCSHYPNHKKIFFPCDMNDDKLCFSAIQKYVPGLEMYDRTHHTLSESLSLFFYADAGI